ncbi:Nucleotide-binding universal stress protein, UspA family [Arenibacter nanhaiticus]|uniref:Nucleotide-binding universal stress protein, UspA family n=1 Tax=Arenibacter nanhaiticus TaxID=558155 RepID=A0A1M6JCP6_9FLAO|nr:universal stress protein [Arenibacter nanhaiticus]SHJ44448.1 Nucleotide-binding universal stress protein, UspA family [Arenibacter nanhaiticus]
MKKIVLPTDFSENAWNAISYALQFFKNEKCTFYILHVYTPAFYRIDYLIGGPDFTAIPDSGVADSVARLEKILKDIKRQYPNPNHRFKTVSAFNTLTDEIMELCQSEGVDLIVMGTQGASGVKEIFLGTNSVQVIRKAKIPVLLVPAYYEFENIGAILFPTDYLTHYKKDELQYIIDLSLLHKATLIVMHVLEAKSLTSVQQKNKEYLQADLAAVKPQFKEMEGHNMPNAVQEYIDLYQLDLLVMMNRSHTFLEKLLVKQNVDAIGLYTKVPFLVLRDTAKMG